MRPIYSLLFLALLPFIVGRLYVKGRALPAYRQRIAERFARYQIAAPSRAPLWIHAVSVGECEASFPLVRRLQKEQPDLPILMTCTTPTGSSRIQSVLGSSVSHVYLPYDLPFIAQRFFRYFKPRLGIIMETELWPNLFATAAQLGTPLMIANGRLSDRSMRGYSRMAPLIRPALRAVHRIAAQSETDAERYLQIGAIEGSVINTGNIKYDIEWNPEQVRDSQALRSSWFGTRKVIVAGSTHPGEEAQALSAFRRVMMQFPGSLLVMVPRHPERGRSVYDLCKAEGFATQLYSETQRLTDQDEILVIDRVGELRRFYGACQVAFIGGSLVPHGGQNPLEPLVAGIPVIFGPYMANFKDIRQSILDVQAGVEVQSATELAEKLIQLLDCPEEAESMGVRGEKMVRQNQGTTTRIYELTAALLNQPASSITGL
jgi:3-deoxy-D-manno-octulosonic-acid transferase